MLAELAHPKKVINLFAGVSSLLFERVAGIQPPAPEAIDDLTKISGIGETFARRLNEAGIYTFAQLAESTPEFVQTAAHMQVWQGDPEDWIAQASMLAEA